MNIYLEIRNVNHDKTVLFWSVEPDFNEDTNSIGYIPEISESPIDNGEWISLTPSPIYNAYGFVDTITQRGMMDQRLYYRIRTTDGAISNKVCLSCEEQNYISSYIVDCLSMAQRRCQGLEALLYPRKKFGKRCKNCYSHLDGKIIKAKCPSCYGTTYEGGYFAPVRVTFDKDIQQKTIDKNEYGVSENHTVTGSFTGDIVIEPGDLVIFLRKTFERYIIGSITPSSVYDAIIRQMVVMTQVRADAPEQLIPVDADAYSLEDYSIFRREWKRVK